MSYLKKTIPNNIIETMTCQHCLQEHSDEHHECDTHYSPQHPLFAFHKLNFLSAESRLRQGTLDRLLTGEIKEPTEKDVEYREFKLPGRGWTRVRYEAPAGKKQGVAGYYFGMTSDGEQVRVRGKKNIR